jgi:hypothetical protein
MLVGTKYIKINTMAIEIKISLILEDLSNGFTRFPEGDQYNPEIGCIQTKYGLEKEDVMTIFTHPKLKGKKTRIPKEEAFILIDDVDSTAESLISQLGARPRKKRTIAPVAIVTENPPVAVTVEQEVAHEQQVSQF